MEPAVWGFREERAREKLSETVKRDFITAVVAEAEAARDSAAIRSLI